MSAQPEQQNRRILVIDDNDAIREVLRKILGYQADAALLHEPRTSLLGASPTAPDSIRYEIDTAYQGQEGLEKVRQALQEDSPYSLAFVDMRMPPGWDGLETIEQIWHADPNIQIVICTGYSDYSWKDIHQRLGQTDGLLILKKPFDNVEVRQLACALTEKWQLARQAQLNLDDLQSTIQRRTAELRRSERELVEMTAELEQQKAQLVEEVAQRMTAEAQARHDAMHDSLTGLSNRAVLLDRIERCLHRTKRVKSYLFALLFLDFDRFKIINDSLGHEVGDQLLISIADRLQGNLRVGDTTSRVDQEPDPENDNLSARLGGDEFVILLDGIKNVADATLVAERLQKSLEAPHKIGGHNVTSTASIGVVTSDLGYDSADEMLRDADTAMYRAKAAGRARHQLFDSAMHDEAVVRLELESDLRHALQDEQFRLVYQPIIDLRTGLAVGLEALIRWDHLERGVISPLDFIPVAEETGLIVPIGGWVLLEACQQLKQWQEQFPSESPLCMNVNISKRQLTQSDLVKTIQEVLNTTIIEPRTLKLEITESAIMDSLDEFSPVLQRLRGCGVFLCIDDFGTGHSSLSCLHEFPIDVLKIDRAFLVNMKENREYAAVTQAIVTLAQNLGMDVVAEGVETPQQVAQLQTLEADYAQGYYFARPLRPNDAAIYLQNQRPLAKSA